jgi:hypothetical protein
MCAARRSSTDRDSFSLVFPSDLTTDQVVAWLEALSGLLPGGLARFGGAPSVVLELWATGTHGFRYRMSAPRPQAAYVVGQLRTAVPGVRATPTGAATTTTWTRMVELGMRRRARSLRAADPAVLAASVLASIQGAGLGRHERVVLQWVIRPAVPEQPPPVARAPRSVRLGPFATFTPPPIDKAATADIRAKLQAVNFLGVLRIGVTAASDKRAVALLASVRTALTSVRTAANSLYSRSVPQDKVSQRLVSGTAPFLFPIQLTAVELAGLLAWPIDSPHVAGLPQSRSRHLPPSGAVSQRGLIVARANFPGAERPLAVTKRSICTHLHIVGPTGVGKTALAGNLAAQAMDRGWGVIVMERKGDLFDLVLDAVPKQSVGDVIVLDVGDSHPVGFNLLAEGNPRAAVEDLCQLFEYLYPDMRHGVWARAALYRGLSTLITRPGMTFIDLVPLLSRSVRSDAEQRWRDELVAEVHDPELARFWDRFDGLSSAQQESYVAPILDRVWQLNERPEVRGIIGQNTSSFSMREVIRERKTLLVNLSGLGVETGRLAGTLLLNAIWSAVRCGAADPERPTLVMLDEFQDFLHLPVDPESLLVQARSFGVGLVLAHQHLEQLSGTMRSAVLANARSKVVFQAAADDARVFAREFGRLVQDEDFMNLGQYEVLCRLATDEGVSAPVSGVTAPPPETTDLAEEVRERSRARYGRSPADIEADIVRRRTPRSSKPVKRPRLGGTAWDV